MHLVDEYQRFGFRPAEIVSLLNTHGIPIDLGDKSAGDGVTCRHFPEWKRIMSLESSQSIHDWVFALIDVDPYESGFMPDDLQADFQRYEDLLSRAIARGELQATESTTKRNEATWQITTHAFQAWCAAKGIDYPLPPPKHETSRTETPPLVAQQTSPSRWPWGNYTTKNLELLADVAKQWWSTYDPGDSSTAPTNKEVIEYVTAQGESTKLGDSIASILRADDLPTGRRKGSSE